MKTDGFHQIKNYLPLNASWACPEDFFNAPHGDHHDLWISPENSQRMIMGDDGGAQITYDGGATWSTYQPTNSTVLSGYD